MRALILSAIFTILFCLAGCGTQDRLDALGHPVMAQGSTIRDLFEADLRRLLATRAQKDECFKKLGDRIERVPNDAFWNTFWHKGDEILPYVPSEIRAECKRYYRLSEETYVVYGEDENIMILYFDGSGRLWQYEHLL